MAQPFNDSTMVDFVTDGNVRSAVRAFLDQEGLSDAESSSGDEGGALPTPRPARLGLGAKYVPHSTPGQTAAERRLMGALRKEREGEGGSKKEVVSSEEERESRAGVLGKRKKHVRRDATGKFASTKSGAKADATAEASAEAAQQTDARTAASKGGEVVKVAAIPRTGAKQGQRSIGTGEVPTEAATGVSKPTGEGTGVGHGMLEPKRAGEKTWTASWKPRKKHKIRSRQKNLRRDTRPKDKLPAHLTEETLRGPRVRPVYNVADEASAENVTGKQAE